MIVYKIFRSDEMAAFVRDGTSSGAPVDLADGFIHLSTAAQVVETARRHFAGEDGLWLLACDAEAMGADLRWEPSRGGEPFPHLFRALARADIVSAWPLTLAQGAHLFPAGLP